MAFLPERREPARHPSQIAAGLSAFGQNNPESKSAQTPGRHCRQGGSADDFGDQQEQIGVASLLPGGGQHRVGLAAMMGLVVEEMGDQQTL